MQGDSIWSQRRKENGVWASSSWASWLWQNNLLQWHVSVSKSHWKVSLTLYIIIFYYVDGRFFY